MFTLTRTGATTAALTVNMSVSESGSMVGGAAPATVTFPEGSATAALTVATDDDSVVEASSAITASIATGDEYAVDAQEASAEVAVNDNDTATFSVSASPEEISEGETSSVTVAISNGVTFATDQTIALGFAGSGYRHIAGSPLTVIAAGLYREISPWLSGRPWPSKTGKRCLVATSP